MGLGLNKPTAIFLIFSVLLGVGTKNWRNGFGLFFIFVVCMVTWRFLTR